MNNSEQITLTTSRTGAKCLIDGLHKAGVQVVFGYPGGMVLPIFDALRDSGIRFVLARHEQGAVHMADGYARSSGHVGCCLVTSGPGATNAVTGLATANMDGIPVVCICGQVPLSMIGNDAFQEADTTGITRSITKHNFLVRTPDEIPQIIAESFFIATSGRPGPVLVDVPKDIQTAFTDARTISPDDVTIRGHNVPQPIRAPFFRKLATVIEKSKRPVLYAGAGVLYSHAEKELLEIAERASIPVVTTLMGIGSFPRDHKLSLGMIGMHGNTAANTAVSECDLLICAGARFDDRVTGPQFNFATHAKVIHIDIDRSEIGKSINVDYPVHGDVCEVFTSLLKYLHVTEHENWIKRISELRAAHSFSYEMKSGLLAPQFVIETVNSRISTDDFIVTDVGQNQMWTAQFMTKIGPRRLITSGGLGTMGFGLPAAIGAQIANPGHRVVCIAGDGGIQMNFQELVVAVEHRLPVKIIIINNSCLGMVRQLQQMFYNERYTACSLSQLSRGENEHIDASLNIYLPDFIKLAEAHGAKAMRITSQEEVEKAIDTAFADDFPWVLEFRVNSEENVIPTTISGTN